MYPAGSIVAYIRLNTSEWNKPFGTVKGDIAKLSRLSESVGRKMLALSASIIGVGTIAVREFGKFEHAMRISTSVSNATEKEFAQASDKAIEVSKRWNVAATTVANAYLFLGRAGLTMGEQMKAVEPIVLASKAMLTDLENTTEGVINIIRAFNYTFEDTAQIVGQVTYAANKSTQSLDDILVALSYAGKPAQAANTSFQQLAAALSIAANQGIRGSKAGVALRFAFTSLMRPTAETMRILQKYNIQVYDSEMRMKPLPDLLQEIEEGLAGVTEKRRNEALATIVGVRATSTWLALLSGGGSRTLREWTENLKNAGNEAEIVAKDQLKALLEKWGQLKKGIQAVVYALVDQFSPGLKGVIDKLIELTQKTEDWVKANKDQVKDMVKNLANLGILAGKVGLALVILPKILNLATSLVSVLLNPVVLAGLAVYGLSVIYRDKFKEIWETVSDYAGKMYDSIKKFWDDTVYYSKNMGELTAQLIYNAITGTVKQSAKGYGEIGKSIFSGLKWYSDWFWGGIESGINKRIAGHKEAMKLLQEQVWTTQDYQDIQSKKLGIQPKKYPLYQPKNYGFAKPSQLQKTSKTWSDILAPYKEEWDKKWKPTIKSDIENVEKYIISLIPVIEELITKFAAAFGIDMPKDWAGKLEELQKILEDLINSFIDAYNAAEDAEPPVKKLLETLGGGKPDPRGDWFKFLDAWDGAKKTITGNLLTIQETCEGVVQGMTNSFEAGMTEWMQGGWSLVGAFKDIFNRIWIEWSNLIAKITVNSIMQKIGFPIGEDTMTWGRGIATFKQGGGFGAIADWIGSLFGPKTWPGVKIPPRPEIKPNFFASGGMAYKPTLAMIGESGTERVLNPRETMDYNRFGNHAAKAIPNITFNVTNEIPGAELAVVSAETQADRTVLNATMRLAASNTMFRRTFVNPGGR